MMVSDSHGDQDIGLDVMPNALSKLDNAVYAEAGVTISSTWTQSGRDTGRPGDREGERHTTKSTPLTL